MDVFVRSLKTQGECRKAYIQVEGLYNDLVNRIGNRKATGIEQGMLSTYSKRMDDILTRSSQLKDVDL